MIRALSAPVRPLLLAVAAALLSPAGAQAGPKEDLDVLARRLDEAELADDGRIAREALAAARTAVGEARAHLQGGRAPLAQRAFGRGRAWARLAEALLASAQAEREARQAGAEADALEQRASEAHQAALERERRLKELERQIAPEAP